MPHIMHSVTVALCYYLSPHSASASAEEIFVPQLSCNVLG
jgi:hypothetical protein